MRFKKTFIFHGEHAHSEAKRAVRAYLPLMLKLMPFFANGQFRVGNSEGFSLTVHNEELHKIGRNLVHCKKNGISLFPTTSSEVGFSCVLEGDPIVTEESLRGSTGDPKESEIGRAMADWQ